MGFPLHFIKYPEERILCPSIYIYIPIEIEVTKVLSAHQVQKNIAVYTYYLLSNVVILWFLLQLVNFLFDLILL